MKISAYDKQHAAMKRVLKFKSIYRVTGNHGLLTHVYTASEYDALSLGRCLYNGAQVAKKGL